MTEIVKKAAKDKMPIFTFKKQNRGTQLQVEMIVILRIYQLIQDSGSQEP